MRTLRELKKEALPERKEKEAGRKRESSGKWKMFLPSVIAIIILVIAGQILANGFLSIKNIGSILMTASLLALMSVAQNTVMISGDSGIDLSVGAIASMTALICPMIPMANSGMVAVGAVAAVVLGAAVGLINGAGIKLVKIPSMIMTLIMSSTVSGITMVITKGQPAAHISEALKGISDVIIQPIRLLTLIVLIILILAELVLTRAPFGRKLRITGDNPNAAAICGIQITGIGIAAYVISGAVAGLTGLFLAGYAGSTTMTMGESYTLLSVAAVAIGGTNLAGGKGSYLAGALGALVLVILNSILQALNMEQGVRSVIQGLLLVFIVFINTKSTMTEK